MHIHGGLQGHDGAHQEGGGEGTLGGGGEGSLQGGGVQLGDGEPHDAMPLGHGEAQHSAWPLGHSWGLGGVGGQGEAGGQGAQQGGG